MIILERFALAGGRSSLQGLELSMGCSQHWQDGRSPRADPRTLARSSLSAEIPAQLRPWLLSFDWDREKLWGLDRPRERLAVSELVWHLALPWWRHEGRWFKVSPHAFLDRPAAFPEHVHRVEGADLGYRIHAIRRRDRWLIVDGIHRLVKAIQLGLADLDAVRLEPSDLSSIVRTQEPQ